MSNDEILKLLRELTVKWTSQRNHPQRMNKDTERDLIDRHITDLRNVMQAVRSS